MSSCRRRDRREIIDCTRRSRPLSFAPTASEHAPSGRAVTIHRRARANPGRRRLRAGRAHRALPGRSPRPTSVHGYLSWYEPADRRTVAGGGRRASSDSSSSGSSTVTSACRAWGPVVPSTSPRSGWPCPGLAFLLVQETIEHSVAAHSLSLVSVTDGRWLGVLVVVTASAAALAFLARLGRQAVRALLAEKRLRPERRIVAPAWSTAPGERRRARPLALHGALRAPPAFSPA